VSDLTAIDRRDLLRLGKTGIVGATTALLTSCVSRTSQNGAPKAASQSCPLSLTIQGGYAWLFRSIAGKTTATVMSLKSSTCTDQTQWLDHEMLLIINNTLVNIEPETNYPPQTDVKTNRSYWNLEGQTTLNHGMPGNGIVECAKTPWSSLIDPYAPKAPNDDGLWDDEVWLAGPEKAKDNPESLASRYLNLTDGYLTIHQPRNEQAKLGRWVFTDAAGKVRKKALTDVLELTGTVASPLVIQTAGDKQIVLSPKVAVLALAIRHQLDLDHIDLYNGYKLMHFGMLYDFVDKMKCDQAVVPAYELRTDLTLDGWPTPGDLCPPLALY
jgi:hypothetical protein